MKLSEFSIQNPVKVAVGVILVCMFGIVALTRIPIQLTPEVTKPIVTVETRWPGASPQEIEREIIDRQEEQLKSVTGLVDFRSECSDSYGEIVMELTVGTDLDAALVEVGNKLDQVREYPLDAERPTIETVSTGDRSIAWLVLMPVPPQHDEIRSYIERYPHLASVLTPLLSRDEIHVPALTRLAETHSELAELVKYRFDPTRLRKFAEDRIEAHLEQVPGVADSTVRGGRKEQVEVVVDPAKLAARKITIPDLRRALAGENKDVSAGDLWEEKRRYVIRTVGQFDQVRQVEQVIVARRDGAPVFVRDVATVRLGYSKPDSASRQQGIPSMSISVQRQRGANVLEVMAGVKKAVAELNDGVLAAKGLRLWQVYDETGYIESAIRLVRNNVFIGGLLATAVLWLFLRSGRSTLVVAMAIPISVIGAFLIISALGLSINVISLAGMAFAVGMVLDSAIVVLENIYAHYQRGCSPREAASRGATEVWGAILASTLTTLAVFVPIVFVQEQAGQLFRDIAIAISAAVALSLLVSLTVIPSAASRLLSGRTARRGVPRDRLHVTAISTAVVEWIVERTRQLQGGRIGRAGVIVICLLFAVGSVGLVPIVEIREFTRWPYTFPRLHLPGLALAIAGSLAFAALAFRARRLALVLSMIIFSLGMSAKLMPPAEYLPEGNRNLVVALIMPPPGYNLDQMVGLAERIEERLRPYWECEPGSEEEARLGGPHIANCFAIVRGPSIFMGARSTDPSRAADVIDLLKRVTADLPGVIPIVSQSSLFERSISGGRIVDIEVSGPELDKLIALGTRIFDQVKQMYPVETTGTFVRPVPSLDLGSPELHIYRNNEKASQRGVITTDLGYTIDALVDGAYAGDYWHEGNKIDLIIKAPDSVAQRTQHLAQLPIETPSGEMVPLSAVADMKMSSGPAQILRIDRQRAITIQVKTGPDIALEDAMYRIEREVLDPIRASNELQGGLYGLRLAGTADELKQMRDVLTGRLMLAVIITYLLIAALYESFLYPLVIMVSVPMAAVGGFAGLRLLNVFTHQGFDTLTMIGFVILIGTVVNNAILIVNHALVLIRRDGQEHREAVAESVRGRIRPIFMSTSTTVLGMLPLVVFPGAGSELYRGLGSVVLGGLVVSTVFTLLLVPMLFTLALESKTALKQQLTAGRSQRIAKPVADQERLLDQEIPSPTTIRDPTRGVTMTNE